MQTRNKKNTSEGVEKATTSAVFFAVTQLCAKIPRHAVNWVTRKLGCIARHEENASDGVVKSYS